MDLIIFQPPDIDGLGNLALKTTKVAWHSVFLRTRWNILSWFESLYWRDHMVPGSHDPRAAHFRLLWEHSFQGSWCLAPRVRQSALQAIPAMLRVDGCLNGKAWAQTTKDGVVHARTKRKVPPQRQVPFRANFMWSVVASGCTPWRWVSHGRLQAVRGWPAGEHPAATLRLHLRPIWLPPMRLIPLWEKLDSFTVDQHGYFLKLSSREKKCTSWACWCEHWGEKYI